MDHTRQFFSLVLSLLLALSLLPALAVPAAAGETETMQFLCPTGLPEEPEDGPVIALEGEPDDGIELLSSVEELYSELEARFIAAWANRQTAIDVRDLHIPSSQWYVFADYYKQCVYDHPEYFYVRPGHQGGTYAGSVIGTIKPTYDAEDLDPSRQQALEKAVEDILTAYTSPHMTDVEKVLALHDYLVLNCDYNWEVANHIKTSDYTVATAYSALVKKDAVCQGYAMGYNLLLNRAGIETRYLSSDAMNHGWSLVKLGDHWYHVDVTWDDPGSAGYDENGTRLQGYSDVPGHIVHDHFLRSSDSFENPAEGSRHHGFVIKGVSDGTELERAHDARYEYGWLFCGARTPFIPFDEKFYYLSNNKQITSVTDLQDLEELPCENRYALRWTVAAGEGSIYYTLTDDLYSNTVTMKLYRYDPDREAACYLSSVTLPCLYGIGLKWYGDELWLARADGRTGPVQVHQVGDPDRYIAAAGQAPFGLSPILSDSGDTLQLWGYNGSVLDQQAAVCVVSYDEKGRMLGITETVITLPARRRVQLDVAAPDKLGADLKIFLPDAANYVPLITPVTVENP